LCDSKRRVGSLCQVQNLQEDEVKARAQSSRSVLRSLDGKTGIWRGWNSIHPSPSVENLVFFAFRRRGRRPLRNRYMDIGLVQSISNGTVASRSPPPEMRGQRTPRSAIHTQG
jgi:hypothetical protein